MKREIEIKRTKPRLAYNGMEKVMPLEAVPTQVVKVFYPSNALKVEVDDLIE